MTVGLNRRKIKQGPPASLATADVVAASVYYTLQFKPTVVVVSNPGDFWVHLVAIDQWVAPGTSSAIYQWNGDMDCVIDTSSTPNNSYPFVPGTGQSAEPCTVVFTDDPTVLPNPGVLNRVMNPQATLIGSFTTGGGDPLTAHGPFNVPANTQSLMVVWGSPSPGSPLFIQVTSAPNGNTVIWGNFNSLFTPFSAISDTVFEVPFSCSVSSQVTVAVQEQASGQTYWVLASPVAIASSVSIAQSDIVVPVNLALVGATGISPAIPGVVPALSPPGVLKLRRLAITITPGAFVTILPAVALKTVYLYQFHMGNDGSTASNTVLLYETGLITPFADFAMCGCLIHDTDFGGSAFPLGSGLALNNSAGAAITVRGFFTYIQA